MRYVVWLFAAGCVLSALLLSEVAAGSAKWEKIDVSCEKTLRAVYFGDAKTVFAVGDEGTILKSTDTGKTWSAQECSSKATLRGVHFTDAMHGWACGDGDPDAPSPRGHVVTGRPMKCGTCLITADAGKKWEDVWVQTNFDLRSIWMASEKVGQICNHGGADHPDGDRVITEDGGRTWDQSRVYRGLNDCCWVSDKEGWAVGSPVVMMFMGGRGPKSPLETNKQARIIHTKDGGKTWEPQDSEGIQGQNELRGVWFVDKSFGCAVGDGGTIFLTADGGEKWTLCPSVTDKALYAVCLVDKKKGWAVGKDGLILKTTDGGKKWTEEKSPVEKTLYGLHLDEKGKTGIAVGEGGTVIRIEP
jgi:photosystem II stability/assembly factor-like uncharacterized protein